MYDFKNSFFPNFLSIHRAKYISSRAMFCLYHFGAKIHGVLNVRQGHRSSLKVKNGYVPTHFLLELYWKGTFANPLLSTSRIAFGLAHPLWRSFLCPCVLSTVLFTSNKNKLFWFLYLFSVLGNQRSQMLTLALASVAIWIKVLVDVTMKIFFSKLEYLDKSWSTFCHWVNPFWND